jgi:hypothetical protein
MLRHKSFRLGLKIRNLTLICLSFSLKFHIMGFFDISEILIDFLEFFLQILGLSSTQFGRVKLHFND